MKYFFLAIKTWIQHFIDTTQSVVFPFSPVSYDKKSCTPKKEPPLVSERCLVSIVSCFIFFVT